MANTLNKVNSGGIEDGSIVNADINASAAIAGSKLAAATTSAAGSMSAADKTKLDGIAAGAEVNVQSDWNSTSGDNEILNKPTVPTVTGSTNNTVCTVTGANAITGEANLTFDGSILHAQDSTGTTPGTAQLIIRKGTGAGAANPAFTRANSYIHLGGSEWGTNSDGLYSVSFGYAQGSGATYTPAYLGFKETSSSGNTKGDLVFATRDATSDTEPTESLKISAAGYVTTPKQPVCMRSNSTAKNGSDIEWKKDVIDQGSNWSSTNNRFTAPVGGMYFVGMYGMSITSSGTMDVQIKKNGSDYDHIVPYSGGGGSYHHFCGMGIIELAANDYIHVTQSSGDMWNSTSGRHTGLTIFLIG